MEEDLKELLKEAGEFVRDVCSVEFNVKSAVRARLLHFIATAYEIGLAKEPPPPSLEKI